MHRAGFVAQDTVLNRVQAAFDGFPPQKKGEPIYRGNPLELHYRADFFRCTFPLKLRAMFSNP